MKRVHAHAKKLRLTDLVIRIWEDDGWFCGQMLDEPGVLSQGKTIPSLLRNLADAYTLMKNDPRRKRGAR